MISSYDNALQHRSQGVFRESITSSSVNTDEVVSLRNSIDSTCNIRSVTVLNTILKGSLEDLEQYILGTSESVNEKVEEIQRQMLDLHSEIKSNVELVAEKRASGDAKSFIKVLCSDVR
jgi:hypothetical protein